MGKLFRWLFVLIFLAVTIPHGYMFVSFGTMDPCAAANERLSLMNSRGVPGKDVTKLLRAQGPGTCYAVALLPGRLFEDYMRGLERRLNPNAYQQPG